VPAYLDRLIAVASASPLFPVGYFTPGSVTAFKGNPPPYTKFVCMVTHRCAPWLERVAAVDDRGERPESEQSKKPIRFRPKGASKPTTRKQVA
jgi:hypothetical protein